MTDEARAARYSDLFGPNHDPGENNCAYCPICATVGLLRNTKPEVLEHLAAAAREFIAAASILLDEASEVVAAAEEAAKARSPRGADANVRRIDIS
ncbi:MAG: hypothetical protein M3N53_11510 [Actinomycetota bacterium]|nr:hypothetical protein [Actinomycetota bacterium]